MTLVDSDVIIAHLRGHQEARSWLVSARRDGPLSISAVTVAEVTGGMRSAERQEVRRLLASFTCEPVTRQVGERAGDLRRQFRRSHATISTADYLIAATALVRDLSLSTLNVRHFPMFAGLQAPFTLST